MKNSPIVGFMLGVLLFQSLAFNQTVIAAKKFVPDVAPIVREVFAFSGPFATNGGLLALAQGRDSKLYGTTSGLSSTQNPDGTIFRMNVGGSDITALSVFSGTDGSTPFEGLTLGMDGFYYGTASVGGSSGYGVLFKVNSAGAYSVLHEFTGGVDGAGPSSPPIQASDGNLYGVTSSRIYRYVPTSGTFTTIFTESADGSQGSGMPGPLIQAANGSLYSVAQQGGTADCGVVLEITTSGTVVHVYSFPCLSGGSLPTSALIQGSDGAIYGTTENGGNTADGECYYYGCGTIFKLSNGVISTIHTFSGNPGDGSGPIGAMVQGTDGNLYGTTSGGGANDIGTIYQITPGGQYKLLYSFIGRIGWDPSAALLQHTNGTFYGTLASGGRSSGGAIYSLDMGLSPFIALVRYTGYIGRPVEILGQGLKGATAVTVNGVPATSFKIVSDTYMTAVIPAGATTGPVVATTSTGTLTSNHNLRIVQ